MARTNRIFNDLKRAKLLRKSIPPAEAFAGVVCLVVILGFGVWVAAQKNTFDPAERDVSMEVLREQSVEDTLYRTPLKRWQEPGAGPVAAVSVDLGPLPAELANAPWQSPRRVQTFTPDTLYEKIDGQAEQYLKFGFRRLDVAALQHESGATLDVFLYDQGSFANCLGLFEEQRGGKAVEARDGLLFTRTGVGAYGVAGSMFFQIIGSAASDEITAKTDEILDALAADAGAVSAPKPFQVLQSVLGIPVDRIGYTPINAFQFSFAKDFWFAKPEADGDAQLFVHYASDEAEAKSLFDRLKEQQIEEYDVVNEDVSEIVYRHKYLKTYSTLRRDGAVVFGMDGHPNQDGAERWTQQLAAAL